MVDPSTPPRAFPSGDALELVCIRNLLAATGDMVYFKDADSRFVAISEAVGGAHGRALSELIGLTDSELSTPAHAAAALADERHIMATGESITNKDEHDEHPGNQVTCATSSKYPLRDLDGRIIGTFGVSRDTTRLVRAEEAARRSADALEQAHADLGRAEAQLRTVLESSADAIALYDNGMRYQYANAAAASLAGRQRSQLLGRTDRELDRDPVFLHVWEAGLAAVLETGEVRAVDFSVGDRSHLRWFTAHLNPQRDTDDAPPTGVVASTRDVTDLRRAQEALAHQALHDPLTGLANRVLFVDRLTHALTRLGRQPGRIAVLFVDLDRFKQINDTYGHSCGDRVLVEVARRLTAVARRADTVARLGGDEFVVLCEELSSDADLNGIADRIVRGIGAPFHYGGDELSLSASVGACETTQPQADPERLLHDTDAAMYHAKRRGGNQHQLFTASPCQAPGAATVGQRRDAGSGRA